MKTTVDLPDELLVRAKRHARTTGRPLRAVMEEGLRRVLSQEQSPRRYHLADLSVGDAGGRDPLESFSWQDLRELIYGDRSSP